MYRVATVLLLLASSAAPAAAQHGSARMTASATVVEAASIRVQNGRVASADGEYSVESTVLVTGGTAVLGVQETPVSRTEPGTRARTGTLQRAAGEEPRGEVAQVIRSVLSRLPGADESVGYVVSLVN